MQLSELPGILKEHQLWLRSGGKEGKRADFSNFTVHGGSDLDLQRAILNGASFGDADLTDTNFQRAELRRANFGKAMLRRTNLREADLQNADLQQANFLLSTQLAGADVAGAKLPEAIAKFEGLKTIAEATSNAQKLFIAMLGGCLYSWLTIGTTKDSALLTNSSSSPLPVIGTALPIVGFYLVAPVVLLALYFYFHLNMQRLWEALADLPAVFPDGRPLDKMADPWLLNGLVRAHFFRLRNEKPPLSRMQQWLSILLAWWVVPATLLVFWGRVLMRHDWFGTNLHTVLLTAAIGFGWMSYRLARATLRGALRKPFLWAQAWKDRRIFKIVAAILGTCVVGLIFFVISFTAIKENPYYDEGATLGRFRPQKLVPTVLGMVGFSPFANLTEEDVSTKPPNWTGDVKEYPLVKGARLREANVRYAAAYRAFFVNADMRYADLSNAFLFLANLWHADLSWANLSNADLSEANLWHADLSEANLSNANLPWANLSNAYLSGANLSNANLSYADLSEANLSNGNLSPSGANLSNADLSHAKLDGAYLKGVDLRTTKGLTKSQLEKAKTDESTLLPGDLPP